MLIQMYVCVHALFTHRIILILDIDLNHTFWFRYKFESPKVLEVFESKLVSQCKIKYK